MREVAALPGPADYLADPAALAIAPGEVASMRVDTKHILGDHLDRFPERLRSDPDLARQVFEGALAELPDRIRRNYRLAVAQYYRGNIHLLLPLHLSGASRPADLALVIERTTGGARRASTVLGADHAYRQARVIARLQSDWLAGAWLKPDDAHDPLVRCRRAPPRSRGAAAHTQPINGCPLQSRGGGGYKCFQRRIRPALAGGFRRRDLKMTEQNAQKRETRQRGWRRRLCGI
jgi:hypothetical protein